MKTVSGWLCGVLCAVGFPLLEAHAQADLSSLTCAPSATRLFAQRGIARLTEDLRKLSENEFNRSALLSPAEMPVLAAGTDLSVLVDLKCLISAQKTEVRLPWLRQVRAGLGSEIAGKALGLRSFSWRLERARAFADLQAELDLEPCVRLASPNAAYQMSAGFNDPYLLRQEHLKALHLKQALPKFFLPFLVRKAVTIAIIDSGVDLSHTDLSANRWINPGEIAGNGVDDDRNGYIDDINGYNFASDIGEAGPQGDLPEANHGTHVAGLAAARFDNGIGGVGVNGVARIMSLNIFGPTSSTSSVLLENAIRYAANQGADVINMSLGGREYSRTMRAALEYAVSQGSFIVTAAGNLAHEICDDPEQLTFVSPAAYSRSISGMMTVSSTDASSGRLSAFSNHSKRLVEIAAPGAVSSENRSGLLSTIPGNTYAELAGTSMAAPVVSGAAALVYLWMRTYGYGVTPSRVEEILSEAAKHESALSEFVENGRALDLERLVDFLSRHYGAMSEETPLETIDQPAAPIAEAPAEPAPQPTPQPDFESQPPPDEEWF